MGGREQGYTHQARNLTQCAPTKKGGKGEDDREPFEGVTPFELATLRISGAAAKKKGTKTTDKSCKIICTKKTKKKSNLVL